MGFLSTLGKVLKSKTVWGAVGSGAIIVGQAVPTVAQYVPSGTKLSVVLGLATAAFTIYGRIRAKQPLGPVIDQTIAQTVEAVHVLGATSTTTAETGRMVATTTIANPLSVEGKVMQLAEVKSVVHAVQAAGGNK